jgi:hypothetical protein
VSERMTAIAKLAYTRGKYGCALFEDSASKNDLIVKEE